MSGMRISNLLGKITVVVILCCGVINTASFGVLVVEHQGKTDPVTESWFHFVEVDTTVGPVSDDLGLDAWFVSDNSGARSSHGAYKYNLSDAQASQARDMGWILTVRLRVTNQPDSSNGSVTVSFKDGGHTIWFLDFGADADGSQIVTAATDGAGDVISPIIGIDYDTGAPGYHLYEVIYDPAAGSADVFVDGVERISDWAGYAAYRTPNLRFGSHSVSDTGRGNYNLVRFEIVPEPCTFLLVGLGGLALLRKRST